MYKKIRVSLLLVFYTSALLPDCAPPPFFSNKLTAHLYFGQDLNIADVRSFDSYSLFQYIFDSGIKLEQVPLRAPNQTISLTADARIKGVEGKRGSEFFPRQEFDTFQIWLRDIIIQYCPGENKNNFLQAGYFPFEVGNGFVLGNAYVINTPTSWQYVYEQIDQFRPGILAHGSNQEKSISGEGYVGFIPLQNKLRELQSVKTMVRRTLENLGTSALQNGSHNVVAALQIKFGPTESYPLQISPYLFFQRTNQSVQCSNDATSRLYTPGLYGFYTQDNWSLHFEGARNFGHQHVKEWNITGPNNTSGRTRKSYKNNYAGYFLYLDLFLTKGNIRWGLATSYASGDNSPNDSNETILMAQSIPGFQYKDSDKTYKGFIGAEHFSQATSIHGLYFGIGAFKYTNLALIGSTIEYSVSKENDTLSTHATVVSYFKPTALLINAIDHTGSPIGTPLPHYLGTECSGKASYILGTDLTFSLVGGILFPGSFYRELQRQTAVLEQQATVLFENENLATTNSAKSLSLTPSFFVSFGLSWSFNSTDIEKLFNRT
jgi:hypothetical protein